jgi:hypothetical protein
VHYLTMTPENLGPDLIVDSSMVKLECHARLLSIPPLISQWAFAILHIGGGRPAHIPAMSKSLKVNPEDSMP